LLAANSQRVESGLTTTQKMSYALRFNYSYKGKYLFTFSNRWDGVSFFSPGKKWDSFPAGALAWRVSDESFMKSSEKWLDNLKLRVGAGITGNSGGDEDIKALIKYCKQVPCKVNLIQYNPIGEGKFDHRSIEAEEKYVRELEKAGITALVRRSRGGDIDAACGQLANKNSGE
jgi:hypothetical protein